MSVLFTSVLAAILSFTPLGPLLPLDPPPPAAQTVHYTFDGGSYSLHTPPMLEPPTGYPWMYNDHGASFNGAKHEQQTGMSGVADQYGYVVIYPDGQSGVWDAGPQCCLNPGQAHRNDIAFHRAVLEDARKHVKLQAQGHAMGGSNGGMMAWRLACEAPDIILSAVVVAGTNAGIDCSRTVVRILRLHGKTDSTVPYCAQPTVMTPYPGCYGYAVGGTERLYWRAWKAEMVRPGSFMKVEFFEGGHTWTMDQSKRAMKFFLEDQ